MQAVAEAIQCYWEYCAALRHPHANTVERSSASLLRARYVHMHLETNCC